MCHQAVFRMKPPPALRSVSFLVLMFFTYPHPYTSNLIVLDDTEGLGRIFDDIGGLSAAVRKQSMRFCFSILLSYTQGWAVFLKTSEVSALWYVGSHDGVCVCLSSSLSVCLSGLRVIHTGAGPGLLRHWETQCWGTPVDNDGLFVYLPVWSSNKRGWTRPLPVWRDGGLYRAQCWNT